MTDNIQFDLLRDGGQPASTTATIIGEFVDQAQKTLDVALYDLWLQPSTKAIVKGAFDAAAARGVAIRLVLNTDHPGPIPVPPPPKYDPHEPPVLDVPITLVAGIPDLMHHKYMIRDASEVLTGSTNWTDDSWTREENIVLRVASQELATNFTANFEQLWSNPVVSSSGSGDSPRIDLDAGWVRPWFCPGGAGRLVHRMSSAISQATKVRIASPVLTSGPILATLVEVTGRGGCDIAGVLDATQMEEVYGQWGRQGSWKLSLISQVVRAIPLTGKPSTPYSPTSIHDFMHAKILVAGDMVFTGSFNLSHSGEMNAENVLEIYNPPLAARLSSWIDEVRALYPPLPGPGPRASI